jgi:SAM-dependent methyltransferase
MPTNPNNFNENELDQIAHYATVAENYVNARKNSFAHKYFLDYWVKRILSPINSTLASDKVREPLTLDPMCGNGESLGILLRHIEGKVAVSDISETMMNLIDSEMRTNPRLKILNPQSARNLEIEDSTIDVIFVSGGLHHVYPILNDVLLEFHRVLKPGGYFVFGEPYNGFFLIKALRKLIYTMSSKFDAKNEHPFDKRSILDPLQIVGFEQITLRPWGGVAYLASGPVNVIPFLRKISYTRFWAFFYKFDDLQSRLPVMKNTCLTITGVARKALS